MAVPAGTVVMVIVVRVVVAMVVAVLTMSAGAAGPEQPRPYVNRDPFPQAYRILPSDRLMFPHDEGDWPLKLDSRRQLFVDDYLIAAGLFFVGLGALLLVRHVLVMLFFLPRSVAAAH